jgi:hypothetical protein
MPTWVKVAIDEWTVRAGLPDGRVFRSVNRADSVHGNALSEKVVWQLLRPHAVAAGVPGIAPHDCRRTAAKLCRAGVGELEQIQAGTRPRIRSDDGAISPKRAPPFSGVRGAEPASAEYRNPASPSV